jgi:hypothetical protein
MWVFDGEEWTEEGATESKRQPEQPMPMRVEEFLPELQVIEIVQNPKTNPIPPFPLP